MHIAEISQYFPPYTGGQELYVRSLSLWLARMGHDVTVLTTTKEPQARDSDPNLRVIPHEARLRILNNPISLASLREHDLLQTCDIVHFHNEHSFLTMTGLLLGKWNPPPVVLTLHGQLKFGNPVLDLLEALYSRALGVPMMRRVARVFVNSYEDYWTLLRKGLRKDRVVRVNNAIDELRLQSFKKNGGVNGVKSELGVSAETKLILFVGRLIPRKGVSTLLRAMKRCVKIDPNLILAIIGDGPLYSLCRSAVSKEPLAGKVVLLRNPDDEVVYRYYQAADLMVLPSFSETCPTVILEALFYGCPVLATDIPGIRDEFEDHVRLFPPGDDEALFSSIIRSQPRGNETGGFADRRETFIRSRFTWQTVANTYRDVFESLTVPEPNKRG